MHGCLCSVHVALGQSGIHITSSGTEKREHFNLEKINLLFKKISKGSSVDSVREIICMKDQR